VIPVSRLIARETVAQRFFRCAFGRFIAFAVLLTLILIGETLWQSRESLKGELAIYQRVFEKPLASALWTMDQDKLKSIADGIAEIPDISAVRIVDPINGRLLVQAGAVPAANDSKRPSLAHRFDIVQDEGFGREVVGRAEFHSSLGQVLQRTQGKIALIVVLATIKTLAFWWIFLQVGQRVLGRPLTEMAQSISTSDIARPLALSEPTRKAIANTELALLGTAYDAMVERIKTQQSELKKVNEELDARVRERTRELLEANFKLEQLAHTDVLTGLANRRQFIAMSEIEIARAHRTGRALSLVVCDIDLFKQINDRYGHAVGDKAICHVAGRLLEGVRQIDVVARFGGDEFVILLPDIKLDEALVVAERLRESLASGDLLLEDGRRVPITLSIGVATLEQGDEALEALFHRADIGLYVAKDSGRNRVVSPSRSGTYS
jgi:diguanylate cyclase (GGDEF)-like protein